MKKLELLLYRKNMAEDSMNKMGMGGETYAKYGNAIKVKIKESKKGSYEQCKLEADLVDIDFKTRDFFNGYKETKREYEHYILPEIERMTKGDKKNTKDVEFQDAQKVADKLAVYEIYGKTVKQAENIEHPEVISDYRKRINLTKALIEATQKKLIKCKDPYQITKYELEIFDLNLALPNLTKRLNQRVEYYEKQFLPKYNKDMEDCKTELPILLENARTFIKAGIDLPLKLMLDEYETHKHDEEKLWLFFTALRSRIERVVKKLRQAQKGKQKQGKKYLSKEELVNLNRKK